MKESKGIPWGILGSAFLYILPFQFPGLYNLSWLALVPALIQLKKWEIKRSFLGGILFGNLMLWGVGYWLVRPMVEFGEVPWPLAVIGLEVGFLALSLYYGLIFLFMTVFRERGFSWFLTGPFVWGGMEYLRSLFTFKFPFGFWGYALAYQPAFIQPARWAGLFGVSALIFLVNLSIFELVEAVLWYREGQNLRGIKAGCRKLRGRFYRLEVLRPLMIIILVAALLAGLNLFFGVEQSASFPRNRLTVRLVQNNIPQRMKWDGHYREYILNKTIGLSRSIGDKRPDLVIWPESSLPFDLIQNRPQYQKFKLQWQNVGSHLLAGSLAHAEGKKGMYNSMFLLNEKGRIIQRYDKTTLVPFGEYNPFPFLQRFIDINLIDLMPGQEATVFTFAGWRWRTPICYEILESELVRGFSRGVDFLVTASNEAWYGKSNAVSQMLAATIFRAVENGIPVIRVANTAGSAVIDARGRVVYRLSDFAAEAQVVSIAPQRTETFFSHHGNLAGRIFLGGLILLLIVAGISGRKRNEDVSCKK